MNKLTCYICKKPIKITAQESYGANRQGSYHHDCRFGGDLDDPKLRADIERKTGKKFSRVTRVSRDGLVEEDLELV